MYVHVISYNNLCCGILLGKKCQNVLLQIDS